MASSLNKIIKLQRQRTSSLQQYIRYSSNVYILTASEEVSSQNHNLQWVNSTPL